VEHIGLPAMLGRWECGTYRPPCRGGKRGCGTYRPPCHGRKEGTCTYASLYHGGHTTPVYIPYSTLPGTPPTLRPSCWRPCCRQPWYGLTALAQGVTELTISGLLIYRLTVSPSYHPQCHRPG